MMISPPSQKQCIDGILLVNKPIGLTSNAVLQQVKRLYHAKKAGHTGSLDPLATGMLPICFGEATKVCQYLLDADKCYEVTGLLGVKTATGDSMGEVIHQTSSFSVSESALRDVLNQFTGPIQQVPSMFSALKHQGTPLYKYARAGIDIPRAARPVVIHQLSLNEYDGVHFSLTVSCSKGTYIRNLVEDIGDVLGIGAHVIRLHRVYTSGFSDEPMFTIDALQNESSQDLKSHLLSMDRAIMHLPMVTLNPIDVLALRQGKSVQMASPPSSEGCFRLYSEHDEFIGLGEYERSGLLKVRRLLAI